MSSLELWLVLGLLAGVSPLAKAASQAASPATPPTLSRPAFSLDRSEEDWSAAQAEDRWKHVSLGRDSYLTLAGDLRATYEIYDNYNWGSGEQDTNGYFLRRLMASADVHVGRRTRLFAELRSGDCAGREGGCRRSQDEDRLDWSQLFVAWRGADVEFRLGRQELNYGEGSLLAIRDLNVRRTFDGVKAIWTPGDWRIDLLAFRPAEIEKGSFDNGLDTSQKVWGTWAVKKLATSGFWTRVDLFYLELERDQARFWQGSAPERRRTIGFNLHGKRGAFSSFSEFDWQWGKHGEGSIQAFKLVQRLTWSYPERRFQPSFRLQGAVSSGDRDPADADLQTFHPLFPRGVYYGRLDASGSLNAIVVHPELTLTFSKAWSANSSFYAFWRQSRQDGIYSPPGFPLRRGSSSAGRSLGQLIDLSIRWRSERHVTFELLAAYYEAGGFLERSSPAGQDMRYLATIWHFRF